ncbi:MAG: hypothetical protein EOP08_03170 [Proteobacteria bacterium]|nr:MAG: hypothetical protein EOP08_03170 [Pseudomonadota bacterium]
MALDSIALQAACEARYEAGRRRIARLRATVVVGLVLLVALAEAWLGWLRPPVTLVCGVVLVSVVYAASVRGLEAWRGARLGLVAGLLPLVSSLGAESVGMVCTPAGCSSMCVPACALSGVLAAVWLAQKGRSSSARGELWGVAGVTATAVGALGCACVSYTGAAALALAMAAALGASAALLRPLART